MGRGRVSCTSRRNFWQRMALLPKGCGQMQPLSPGIGQTLLRGLLNSAPNLVRELFVPGRVLEAEVVSAFQDRAILSFGRGMRVEVQTQVPLKEGQRVHVQVQTREPAPLDQAAIKAAIPQGTPPPPAAASAPVLLRLVNPEATPGLPQQAQPTAQTPAQPAAQPQQSQPGGQHLQWLPIPLPGGGQAWAQLVVQEEAPKRSTGRPHGPVHHVRLWWDTPGLGAVQVTMDAAGMILNALFTTEMDETRAAVEQSLPALQERLRLAGFDETRLGARQAPAGETIEPAREEIPRLDRRL